MTAFAYSYATPALVYLIGPVKLLPVKIVVYDSMVWHRQTI